MTSPNDAANEISYTENLATVSHMEVCGATLSPTQTPTTPSLSPSLAPSITPTLPPSSSPSSSPTLAPSLTPSSAPTLSPSISPTKTPSKAPSQSPVQITTTHLYTTDSTTTSTDQQVTTTSLEITQQTADKLSINPDNISPSVIYAIIGVSAGILVLICVGFLYFVYRKMDRFTNQEGYDKRGKMRINNAMEQHNTNANHFSHYQSNQKENSPIYSFEHKSMELVTQGTPGSPVNVKFANDEPSIDVDFIMVKGSHNKPTDMGPEEPQKKEIAQHIQEMNDIEQEMNDLEQEMSDLGIIQEINMETPGNFLEVNKHHNNNDLQVTQEINTETNGGLPEINTGIYAGEHDPFQD